MRECLTYDPLTGALTWLERPLSHFANEHDWRVFNSNYAGEQAGTVSLKNGYRHVALRLNGQKRVLRGHRIAYALMKGRWPEHEIDHRDGDHSNNRWRNLTPATHAQGHQNRALGKNNTSGRSGVHFEKRRGRWRANITVNWRSYFLGYFGTREEAYAAYLAAKAQLHPFQPTPREAPIFDRLSAPP